MPLGLKLVAIGLVSNLALTAGGYGRITTRRVPRALEAKCPSAGIDASNLPAGATMPPRFPSGSPQYLNKALERLRLLRAPPPWVTVFGPTADRAELEIIWILVGPSAADPTAVASYQI